MTGEGPGERPSNRPAASGLTLTCRCPSPPRPVTLRPPAPARPRVDPLGQAVNPDPEGVFEPGCVGPVSGRGDTRADVVIEDPDVSGKPCSGAGSRTEQCQGARTPEGHSQRAQGSPGPPVPAAGRGLLPPLPGEPRPSSPRRLSEGKKPAKDSLPGGGCAHSLAPMGEGPTTRTPWGWSQGGRLTL